MKKLFTLLTVLMLSVSASFAQQNFYFWKKIGYDRDMRKLSVFPASGIDSLTFDIAQKNIKLWKDGKMESAGEVDSLTCSVGSWLFNIKTSEPNYVTTDTLRASVNVTYADDLNGISRQETQKLEVGVCISSTNECPTLADDYKSLGTGEGTYDFIINELEPGTTYYYRAYVKMGGHVWYYRGGNKQADKLKTEVFYGDVKSFTTNGEKPTTSNYVLVNGHKFVDLGLPSGLLWACNNIGATSSTDYGHYGDKFAWGETESKEDYYWYTYKWKWVECDYEYCEDENFEKKHLAKYNHLDGKTILEPEDDAATVIWGAGCRMPSFSDFQELLDTCSWTWQNSYKGLETGGFLVTGPNGNSIYFPINEFRSLIGGESRSFGFYWTSSRYRDSDYNYNDNYARTFYFKPGYINIEQNSYDKRQDGYCIRPVAERDCQ